MPSAYAQLERTGRRVFRLRQLQWLAGWDRMVCMPPQGAAERAALQGELAAMLGELEADPQRAALLNQAAIEVLDDDQRANLSEMQREWRLQSAIPESLARRTAEATAVCSAAWPAHRASGEWAGFEPLLRRVVEAIRDEAHRMGDALGCSPYDALLQRRTPGQTQADLHQWFGDIQTWLPGLLRDRLALQARSPAPPAWQGPFPVAGQRRICEALMARMGFDAASSRLDVAAHPMFGGLAGDARVITAFDAEQPLGALLGTWHELGHACYGTGLPAQWRGLAIGAPRSPAIHESQSLLFEWQLGGHPGFAAFLSPLLAREFGAQPAFTPEHLHATLTRVAVGPVRITADELSYPAHILLRWEIESALVAGTLDVAEVPARWEALARDLLGLEVDGASAAGALQDIHWAMGLFGYFPCYLVGAMYAAQWVAAMRRDIADLDARLMAQDWAPLLDWLRERIWRHGSRWPAEELTLRATGEPLTPAHYRRHLETRYGAVTTS